MVHNKETVQMTRYVQMLQATGSALALALMLSPAGAQELTGTLKKIKDSGTITLGYRESSVPFSYLDDKQQPVGFAMDICAKIVAAVKTELKLEKLNVKLNPVTSATRIPLLANGTIDLECGSTTNNPERQKQVAYTNTHFLTATRLVSKKSAAIKSIDDLKGKTIVSTSGTTNIKQMNELNTAKKLGMTILAGKDHAESFLMVETDRAVAFAMDDVLLASLAASSKDPATYEISNDAYSPAEPYGIMIPKDDPAFKKVADTATAALYKAEGPALFKKWFQSPIAPKGLNLDFKLSPQLEKMLTTPSDSPDPAAY
jgi:glutamate/aspartate transport system substrate-binding protein